MKKRLIRFFIALAISLILALGVFALQAGFRDMGTEFNRIMCDVTFSVGTVYLCLGLLIFVTNLGVFDFLAYGMASFFNLFRKRDDDRRFVDYLEYKEARKNSTMSWGFLAIIGIVYIAVSFVFLCLIE